MNKSVISPSISVMFNQSSFNDFYFKSVPNLFLMFKISLLKRLFYSLISLFWFYYNSNFFDDSILLF